MPAPLADPAEVQDSPVYWFFVLDCAVEQGDHAAAAEAQIELARLGVRVRYSRPRQPRKGGSSAV